MIHNKRIRIYTGWNRHPATVHNGIKSTSAGLKGGGLIITFLHLAAALRDWKLNSFFLLAAVENVIDIFPSSRGSLWDICFNAFIAGWQSPD